MYIASVSLLRDIQRAATSSETKLTDLLRMCKMLASRLGNAELAKWADNELNGYESREDLPPYRILEVGCRGDFSNGAWMNRGVPISAAWVQEEHRDPLFHAYLTQGIAAYESIRTEGEEPIKMMWPTDATLFYRNKISTNGYDLLDAYRTLAPSQIAGLLDAVRNRVLSFAIDIERVAPHAGDEQPGQASALPQEHLAQIFHMTVLGGTNNIAAGSSLFTQNMDISVGDIDSLKQYLKTKNVPSEDIEELGEIVRTEKLEGRSLGKRTLQWLGKMATKAASGVWGAGVAVGTEVLTKAVMKYYGL